MTTLIDTCVLTTSILPARPMHQTAIDAVADLTRQGGTLCLVSQNIYEFWVVATRPVAVNGLGFDIPRVQAEVARLKQIFTMLHDTPLVFTEWEKVITQYQVVGKNAHDARLVAAMKVHGIQQLLTFNTQDFARYQGITVLSPAEVLKVKSPITSSQNS